MYTLSAAERSHCSSETDIFPPFCTMPTQYDPVESSHWLPYSRCDEHGMPKRQQTHTQPMAVQCTGENNKHLWILRLCQTPLNFIWTDCVTTVSCLAPTQYDVPSFSWAQSTPLTAAVLDEHLFCNSVCKRKEMNVWTSTDILSKVDNRCIWLSSYLKHMFQICMCNIVIHSNYLPVLLLLPFCLQRNNREERRFSEVQGKRQEATGRSCSKATSAWLSGKTSSPKSSTAVGQAPEKWRISICGDFPPSTEHSPKPPDQVLECKSQGREAKTHLNFSVILSLGNKQTK